MSRLKSSVESCPQARAVSKVAVNTRGRTHFELTIIGALNEAGKLSTTRHRPGREGLGGVRDAKGGIETGESQLFHVTMKRRLARNTPPRPTPITSGPSVGWVPTLRDLFCRSGKTVAVTDQRGACPILYANSNGSRLPATVRRLTFRRPGIGSIGGHWCIAKKQTLSLLFAKHKMPGARRRCVQDRISFTTCESSTPVNLKSSPWWRYVNF